MTTLTFTDFRKRASGFLSDAEELCGHGNTVHGQKKVIFNDSAA